MKILVTGGAGFIGSHLCEELAKDRNNNIYSLDNYSIGTPRNHVDNVTYIKGDTADIKHNIVFVPDVVYHLGEYSRVEQSFEDIKRVWSSNQKGTFEVIEFCREHNVKLVYAGSSTKFAISENGSDLSPYAWTKARNTELIKNYNNWFGLSYAIVYFYNVYGGREISDGRYSTLIALFKEKIKEKKPLTVVSPGTQKRNFTHINDIINGLILVGEKGVGDEYGIGCNDSYSILEIAKMFGGKIEMIPERQGNRVDGKVMTSKTLELGWRVKHSVGDYIQDFLKTS